MANLVYKYRRYVRLFESLMTYFEHFTFDSFNYDVCLGKALTVIHLNVT